MHLQDQSLPQIFTLKGGSHNPKQFDQEDLGTILLSTIPL